MSQRSLHVQANWLRRLTLAIVTALWMPAASANIEIDVRGVDDELRNNVLAYLSFDRYRKSESLSLDTLERLHNRVEREVAAALKPFGYYEPKTKSELQDLGSGNWRVNVTIDPGPPVIMDQVDIHLSGPGANDILFQRVLANPPLRKGDRLSHTAYEKIKGDLQRTASNYGYLDARMVKSELMVDPEGRKASAVLEMETGLRYRFGNTSIEQQAIDNALVRRYMRYELDEPFDVTELLRTQFALDDSQYFSTVEVLPGDPDREHQLVPVNIRADASDPARYSFAAGYGTDTAVRGTIQWENRRINTKGHRFNVELKGASETQSLTSHYIVPIGDPALEKLAFETTYVKEQPADIETQDFRFEPSVTYVNGRWQRVYFVTATNTSTRSEIEKDTDSLLIPGLNFALVPQGYLGEELFSKAFFFQIRGSTHSLGSNSDFLQVDTTAERTFDLSPKWHLYLRGEVGASLVSESQSLPGSVRFFAGGDRSVRGFGYNELSPEEPVIDRDTGLPEKDEDGNDKTVKVGGKHLLTGTVELTRDLPKNLGVATFFDFGNAFDHFGDELEYSVGIGLRWRVKVVTLGLDIAQPLSEPGSSPRLHINIIPQF
jgi:translocation and assembly module TamA